MLLVIPRGAPLLPALPVSTAASLLSAPVAPVFAPAAMFLTAALGPTAAPLLASLLLSLLSVLAQLFFEFLKISHD